MSAPQCRTVSQQDSQPFLAKMGIDEQDIVQALTAALYERRRSTKLHPVIDGGFRFWSELVASLRSVLIAKDNGWIMVRRNRMELVSNPTHGINMIITSGDKDTGLADGWPKTKNAKGEATMSIVSSNSDTIEMFPLEHPFTSNDGLIPVVSADGTKTYIVLYFYDAGKKEIRCEISFPVGMKIVNGFAKVNYWSERLIISPLPFDGADIFPEEDFTDDVSISIDMK
ncbi:hypothetical protein [Rouxiella badensis]|uniref:hypothetical protein n=1 Tax=Rouxiella badensis TaxID=1646377 RepID=UPI0022AA0E7F|nr:hypothetical protein [Rouxiella badensis]WAT07374.1 hypothetical protein O1V65_13820 [Rouxiella badensis]